jgi:hypothetical protein
MGGQCWGCDAYDNRETSRDEQRKPHGQLPLASAENPQRPIFIFSTAGAASQSNGRAFEWAPKFVLAAIPVAMVVVPNIDKRPAVV